MELPSIEGLQFRIEREERTIGNNLVVTTWLVHPNGRCRCLLTESWTEKPKPHTGEPNA